MVTIFIINVVLGSQILLWFSTESGGSGENGHERGALMVAARHRQGNIILWTEELDDSRRLQSGLRKYVAERLKIERISGKGNKGGS